MMCFKGLPVTKVRLYPESGRTHQLRVHCLAIGHPILGDNTYQLNQFANDAKGFVELVDQEKRREQGLEEGGSDPWCGWRRRSPRMMLHAYTLEMLEPRVQENMNPERRRVVEDYRGQINLHEDKGLRIFERDHMPPMADKIPIHRGNSDDDGERRDRPFLFRVASDDPFPMIARGSGEVELVPDAE
jgi:hypothetical protein